jgi:hypothetical protein
LLSMIATPASGPPAKRSAASCTRCSQASRSTRTGPPSTPLRPARVLASPLLRRAARSPHCRREVPLTLSGRDPALVEGVADLIFEEDGALVVIEFKTDVEIGEHGLERYRRQVGFYVAAARRATGRAAEGILLRV